MHLIISVTVCYQFLRQLPPSRRRLRIDGAFSPTSASVTIFTSCCSCSCSILFACQATSLFEEDARSLQDVLSVSVLSTDSKANTCCHLDTCRPPLQEAAASHILQRVRTMVTSCRIHHPAVWGVSDCPYSRSSSQPFLCHPLLSAGLRQALQAAR